jgi:hypothetical protein
MNKILLNILVPVLLSVAVFGQSDIAQLKKSFLTPQDEARPWVYWYIMDGYLNKPGIRSNLEAMKKAGINGVIFCEIGGFVEKGKVDMMSTEWRENFKFAVQETERLGMEFTLGTGPGWTGSGGSWVSVEESMLNLVSSATNISGNADVMLPRPKPEDPFFGMESLSEPMRIARDKFYKDVRVLAYPKTDANKPFSYLKERTLYIRSPFSSDKRSIPSIPMPSPGDIINQETGINPDKMIDLTSIMQPDGRLVWNAPAGEWTVYRFGITTSGANTRPAPVAGYGFECSKLDTIALMHHFENFHQKLIDDLGKSITGKNRTRGWNMLHIDSWEMGPQNWSYDFPSEFKKRRGYDMIPYLPAYSGQIVGDREKTERFLWDMRMTAQELMLENHANYVKKFAHKNGMGLSIEPYDMNPASDLALGAIADVPMCEFWTKNRFITAFSCIEATSVAHTNNKKIVAAEAMTFGHTPGWIDNPGNMKGQVDWGFASGINRMNFHVSVLQPYLDRFPGMSLGSCGSFYNPTQTWWSLSTGWHDYIARCQYLLRQGKPVADILFLDLEGAPSSFAPPSSVMNYDDLWMPDHKGFNFDGCEPQNFIANAEVKNGLIVFPGNKGYHILVLPTTGYMTPELLKKINHLIQNGAHVIGFAPKKSPSLVNFPQCDIEIASLVKTMWGTDNSPKKIGKGILYPCSDKDTINLKPFYHAHPNTSFIPPYIQYNSIETVLHKMGIKEDFTNGKSFRYTHRELEAGDLYFVSNRLKTSETGTCTFRATGKSVTLLNPLNGLEYAANIISSDDKTTTLKIQLEPEGSIFVLFDQSTTKVRKLPELNPELLIAKEIDTPWNVRFNPRFGGPSNRTFNQLMDWSSSSENEIKYYSGTAKYTTKITLTASEIEGRTFLDLGIVEVIAGVKINGKNLGVVWKTPYKIETTGVLKTGNNTIEIEVANLWGNRLIGDQLLPENKRYTWTNFNPYKGTDKLFPSGLIGPAVIKKTKSIS